MAANFGELVALRQLDPGTYESLRNPEAMGNIKKIAYGGCSLAVGVSAAYSSVNPGYDLYSVQGSFLGPAQTDRNFRCSVEKVRDTKTFATRLVHIRQRQIDGEDRACLVMLADFQKPEAKSILEYSKPPLRKYSHVEDCPSIVENRQKMVVDGIIPASMAELHGAIFGLMGRFVEQRSCREGIAAQNLFGMNKKYSTTQDGLHITDKTSAEWDRVREPLKSPVENAAALAFLMDAALAFVPLTHSKMFLDDSSACSTLEFSLRILGEFNLNNWHLRESKTVAGGVARTYSEGQLWDEHGRMVACMTQQCILRPKL